MLLFVFGGGGLQTPTPEYEQQWALNTIKTVICNAKGIPNAIAQKTVRQNWKTVVLEVYAWWWVIRAETCSILFVYVILILLLCRRKSTLCFTIKRLSYHTTGWLLLDTDIKFAAYMAVAFITFLHILLILFCQWIFIFYTFFYLTYSISLQHISELWCLWSSFQTVQVSDDRVTSYNYKTVPVSLRPAYKYSYESIPYDYKKKGHAFYRHRWLIRPCSPEHMLCEMHPVYILRSQHFPI